MWVEIQNRISEAESNVSSSSWGCELKLAAFLDGWGTGVILFVRMWVEISVFPASLQSNSASSSSWGCELKYFYFHNSCTIFCHPLREDVSWNTYGSRIKDIVDGHPLREDVSWNFLVGNAFTFSIPSSSSWGCELKYNILLRVLLHNVILFVRMWVEIIPSNHSLNIAVVILFVRMWVEIIHHAL